MEKTSWLNDQRKQERKRVNQKNNGVNMNKALKTVVPKNAKGFNMSLAQIFGSGPKWTISCGDCSVTFKKRIPIVNEPGIECPHCGAVNVLPLIIT